MRLWITADLQGSEVEVETGAGRRLRSVPGGVDPLGERVDDCTCDVRTPFDDHARRSDLADDRRHPCLAEQGHRHPANSAGGDGERTRDSALEKLRKPPTAGRGVAVALVVRSRAVRLVRREPEADVD